MIFLLKFIKGETHFDSNKVTKYMSHVIKKQHSTR